MTGSPNDGVGNERLPYVKFEYRKNLLNNNTGRAAATALESNDEIEYDARMEVNNHRSGIQVNYCNEWHTENGNDYPSPTTSESSSSSCSYTDSLSNSSRSTTSDNLIETETSNGHTSCTNRNSHILNTEHNRPLTEFEQQCAQHQIRPNIQTTTEIHDNSNDTSLTQPVGWQSNVGASSRTKINIEQNSEDDSSNGACAVHTFVTFTHTIRDINEVNSSIEPKPNDSGVEAASQDVLATVSATHSHPSGPNETKKLHINASIVVSQPEPSAIPSSFIKPLPLDTSTSVDTFSVQKQAEWDADKNNNPLHYKDKRTKALPISTVNAENVQNLHTKRVNSRSLSSENSANVVQFSASEKFVPILHEPHELNRDKVHRNLSLASAASTPLFSCDADNKDENEHIACVNAKICLSKNSEKTNKCKLKYRKTVYGCLCGHKFRISVRKSHSKCDKRRGGSKYKCVKKSTECTKRQKSIDRRKNRIDKHQVHWCNYKWKCCRGHLRDYDLCETFLVTSKCGKTKSSPNWHTKHHKRAVAANGVRQNSGNCARKSNKIQKSGDRSADGSLSVKSQHKRHSGSNDGSTCYRTANVTLPYSSATSHRCDAIESTLANDTDQSVKAINKASDSTNKERNRLITATKDEKRCTNNVVAIDADAVELKKTLELSPPIEKIRQVLNAVKCSDSDRSAVNCDNNRCVENATNPTECDDSTDFVTLNANSLKNSLKFSESCDSIFTLKRSALASSTSSLLSLNAAEPLFEASNRLRRLEERFKDFASTTSSAGKQGRCVNNNLSQSSTLPTHHIDSKGHSDASTQQQQVIDARQSIRESSTYSVTDKTHFGTKSSHLNDGVITSGNEQNLKYSDSNNNHIKSKINEGAPIETKHICCQHTIQKRKHSEHLSSDSSDPRVVQFDRRESPIGVRFFDENDSIAANRQISTSDKSLESIDIRSRNAYNPSINKFDGSNTAHISATNESLESSLKKDFTQQPQQKRHPQETHTENETEDVKPNPNPNSKSSTTKSLNDDQLPKIDTHTRNSIGSSDINSIHFDDNKNNLEQTLGEANGINREGIQSEEDETSSEAEEVVEVSSTENTSNANETKETGGTETEVQQLDNIANRLINCTPVSISTESEEISNLFPENQRPTNDSPFIYRDEELQTNCIFDVRQFSDFHLPSFDQIYECYDELDDDIDDTEIPLYGLNVNQSKGM